MAHIMKVGADKYGALNWQKGLTGGKSGLNHALKHLNEYMQGTQNDYGPRSMHLAQVAVNCMFEAYFARQAEGNQIECSCCGSMRVCVAFEREGHLCEPCSKFYDTVQEGRTNG